MDNMATTARPLVLGGAGFSCHLHPDPESLLLRQILLRAFDLDVRTIGTSPCYEPSEQLIGADLAHPSVSTRYSRADWGFDLFRAAGVNTVFCSSLLAVGLLRNGSIPVGRRGDWHPAPPGLGAAAQQAALWVEVEDETRKETFAGVALRYAVAKTMQNCRDGFSVTTITGASTLSDLEQNVATAKQILQLLQGFSGLTEPTLDQYTILDDASFERGG